MELRIAHGESLCRAAEPAIETLSKYHAEHGTYPTNLQDIPDFQRLAEASNVTFRQGRKRHGPWDVGFVEGPQMVIYLWPHDYLCIVPLERPAMMSFTRFDVLKKDSHSRGWAEDHLIWDFSGF
jgi:hypothetical protein